MAVCTIPAPCSGLKGQCTISPGQRPGYQVNIKVALKGQKQKIDDVNNAYALSERLSAVILTQGDVPGYVLVDPIVRRRPNFIISDMHQASLYDIKWQFRVPSRFPFVPM